MDEETFQKVMGELQDMRLLLSSLMRHMTIQSTSSGVPSSGSNGAGGMSVSASMVPSGLDSPSADSISRAELLRRFNVASAFDPVSKLIVDLKAPWKELSTHNTTVFG